MVAALLLIPLLAHAQVGTSSVRLGDLLAPGAGVSAAEAATIVIRIGPAPGSPLELDGAESRARLQAAGLDTERFAIPAHIEITRAAQPLALHWIQAALKQHFHREFAATSILFAPPLSVATGDPGVEVEDARVDRVRGELEVRCRARRDLELLPFTVAVKMTPAELSAMKPPKQAAAAVVNAASPVLVHAGQVAVLAVNERGFQLVTQVMPLEAGRQGEHIRALSLATHATLQVEVAGLNQVRAVTVIHEAPHAVQ